MPALETHVMPISTDEFVRRLADSGVMSDEEVASFVENLPAEKKPLDGGQLARELVRQKRLTAYQAQEVYSGRGKSLVLGNYLILDKLGQGGMGLVFKAEHRRMKRLEALKVLSPKVTRTAEAMRRFQHEVEAAARLLHPNIVTAFDADEAGGTHFLVMEYVDGTDLASLVKERGPLPLDQALDCILQAARGLEYAHQHGVVHRDIKPANLLLDREGTVKILDMGLARLESADGPQDDLTRTGQIMGTVDFMAPEQARDTKHADGRADIYSLGATLWYLLAGKHLYAGETPLERLIAHQTKPLPSLRDACPAVSPELEAMFERLVAKTPEARCQTMTEVVAGLESCRFGAAAAPSLHAAVEEDLKLEEFLSEMASSHASRPLPPQARQPASATRAVRRRKKAESPARTAKTAPPPVAEPDVTQSWSGPDVGTDSQMEQTLSGVQPPLPAVKTIRGQPRPPGPPWRPWRRDWRMLAAAAAGGLLLVLLGVWVIVRDKQGREVARVAVPEVGSATIETAPESGAAKDGAFSPRSGTPGRRDGSDATWNVPPGAPSPAVAPFDAKKAKELQEAWAKYLGVPVEMENSIGMRFTLIPPGNFDMGSTEAEVVKIGEETKTKIASEFYVACLKREVPKHRVQITKPFYMGRCEVTQAEYERVAGSNPSGFYHDPACPVEQVSWTEASAFCGKLSELPQEQAAGGVYRLPTEAEWEYACRAGTTTAWYSGDDEAGLKDTAWYGAGGTPHPVGQKSPNAWGLYDMHGNVWEWCQDWYSAAYYGTSPREDPTGPSGDSVHMRVFRGGAEGLDAFRARASCRNPDGPSMRFRDRGFRLARTVSLPTSGAAGPQKSESSLSPVPHSPQSSPVCSLGSGLDI